LEIRRKIDEMRHSGVTYPFILLKLRHLVGILELQEILGAPPHVMVGLRQIVELVELQEELHQVQENLYRLQEELYQLEALRDADRVRRHGAAVEGDTVPLNGSNQRIQNALQTHNLPRYQYKMSPLMGRNDLAGQLYTGQGSDGAEATSPYPFAIFTLRWIQNVTTLKCRITMLTRNNSSVSVTAEDHNDIHTAMHLDGPILMEDDVQFACETGVVMGNHKWSAASAKDADVLLR